MLSATKGRIFVTGATGFLGSHFVREWLRDAGGHVFALVRGKDAHTGASRLAAALEMARLASGTLGQPRTESLTPMYGDVTLPLAGIATDHVAHLRATGVEVFWHFASDLRFEDRNHVTTRHTNVEGARNALVLAIAIGVKRFVYVSTAFVCGRQGGVVEEELVPPGQDFSNGYEASKAEAERMLVAECERLGLPLTILRPSIVIGPRSTRSAYGSDTGLFSLIHAVLWIRSSQSAQGGNLRIPAWPHAQINFIPVDCVIADMLALAKSGYGDRVIYHLTSSASVTVAECWQAVSEVVGMRNVLLMPPDEFEPNPAERLIARRIGFFLSYLTVDRRFKRTLTPTWTLNAAEFKGYVCKCLERIQNGARELSSHAG